MTTAYRVDCIRTSDGTPHLDNGNPSYRPWFVQRVADGACMAQCKTFKSALRSMGKLIAKDGPDPLDDFNYVGSRHHY